jgi:predicted neuraminidase
MVFLRRLREISPAHNRAPAQTPRRLRAWLALLCLLTVLGVESARWLWGQRHSAHAAALPARADAPLPPVGALGLRPQSTALIESPPDRAAAHASTLVALPGNRLLALWWSGSRESGPDVRVYASVWADKRWGAVRAVIDRKGLGAQLGFGVRRLGNPTAWVARDGAVHLYVVATGLGGWAASRVVHLVSHDEGQRFALKRVLPLSPLFNTSVLVRTAPIGLADGGWWLPAYFELGNKYPLLASFDAQGNLRRLSRIGSGLHALQPALAPVSPTELRAWMRDQSEARRIQHAVSHDGGENWSELRPLPHSNQDSSVAVLHLSGGGFVMLHNEAVEPGGSGRSRLRLSLSDDAQTWRDGPDVVRGGRDDEFSYPSVVQLGQELHITYSAQRSRIAHHVYRIEHAGTPLEAAP